MVTWQRAAAAAVSEEQREKQGRKVFDWWKTTWFYAIILLALLCLMINVLEQGWCFRNVAVDFQLMNQSWLSRSLKGLGRGRPGRIWTVLSEGRKLAHADDDGRLFQPPTQKSSMYSKNEHEGCIFHQIRRERRLSLAAVPPPPHDDDPSKLAVASKA